MNNIIKRELDKLHIQLPEYDDNTTHIHIPRKVVNTAPLFDIGKSYIVNLADYIIHEPQGYTLSSNWNKGITPVSSCVIMQVREMLGKMLKVYARGYNPQTNEYLEDIYYDLWLPQEGVTIIQNL